MKNLLNKVAVFKNYCTFLHLFGAFGIVDKKRQKDDDGEAGPRRDAQEMRRKSERADCQRCHSFFFYTTTIKKKFNVFELSVSVRDYASRSIYLVLDLHSAAAVPRVLHSKPRRLRAGIRAGVAVRACLRAGRRRSSGLRPAARPATRLRAAVRSSGLRSSVRAAPGGASESVPETLRG